MRGSGDGIIKRSKTTVMAINKNASLGTGKFAKLKIFTCDDSEYDFDPNDGGEKSMEVMYNPDKLEESFTINYDVPKTSGSSKDKKKFERVTTGDINMEFLFDGTGASIVKKENSKSEEVMEQIIKFRKLTLELNGDTHEPPFLALSWGSILIKGRLKNAKFTYTLFNTSGNPIRAKVNVTLVRSKSDKDTTLFENKSSPDLTHYRTVKAGDTLPLMTKVIYGKTSYYLEVARVNNLRNFTKLTPGDTLYFPPLDKTT